MGVVTAQPDGPAGHFQLSVTPDLCVGAPDLQFLFGGTMLGAAIAAIERSAQRPLIWATAQFLSQAAPGSVLEIEVTLALSGRYNTQAQATARVGDRTIAVVTAALGARPQATSVQWVTPPDVPPPEQCPDTFYWPGTAQMLRRTIDLRPADRAPADVPDDLPADPGRMLFWARPRKDLPVDAALLAFIADFTTAGIHRALGTGHVGNSLDNTLRICRIVPSRWVLCDVRIHAVHAGLAHGEMRLFAQTGELLAIASQSMIVRSTNAGQ